MEKKFKNISECTVFYNNKGEKVKPFEIDIRQDECQNFIDFCCIADVPDGFTLETIDPVLTDICPDFSALKCCLETQKIETTVNSPCDEELTCLVDLQAVRLVGCVRITANTGPLIPNQTPFLENNCTVNCGTTVCVDQILAFTCDQTPPCVPCYKVIALAAFFVPFIDECGREAVRVDGRIFLDFIGCDEE
ncbi:hypothetical protein [Jeotgalibacillus marinus]|uniref:Uncharacterized protein n=1 Tax=Jeotgalibacillus marinus TaxID=86667 RepID=A0ABV3Q6P7_9BACL